MRINSENLTEFKGLPVKDWSGEGPADFGKVVFRLRLEYDEAGEDVSLPSKLASLLETKGSERIESLVIGAWDPEDSSAEPTELFEALVSARDKLPNLRNLFVGDIMGEENEISWIQQGDFSPLLAAYDRLEHLTVRGGGNLTFGTLRHDHLKELIVQTGGLPPSVIHEIGAARLPALEHLELWLGEPNYGGDATVDDLAPLLRGDGFPKLRYLGLKDSVIQDEIAGVVALAPILDRLEVLDLSMGTLGDEGATALLASPAIRKLKKLDLQHHFISGPVAKQLESLGNEVDLSDEQEPSVWGGESHRFIAVSE